MLIVTDDEFADIGRSPHGERGLKFFKWAMRTIFIEVAPRTGSVD